MLRRVTALLALLLALPASAVEIRHSTTPGNTPPVSGGQAMAPGEISINRADGKLFYRKPDGSLGISTLLNALPSGRKAVEQGDGSDLSVAPSGAAGTLGALADPITSPLLAKFRSVVATYDDFKSAGDGLAWTASANVCPAINAGLAYLKSQGGGTLSLPPGVASCSTPIRASNFSHLNLVGQGLGSFGQPGTELRWTGAAGALMLDLRPATYGGPTTGMSARGITLNGNGLAKTGLMVRGLSDGDIQLLIRDTTGPGADIDVDEAKGPLATGEYVGTVYGNFTTGTGGTPGTYTGVPLQNFSGTSGSGAVATITIGGGGSITSLNVTNGGNNYVLGDVLGLSAGAAGNVSGFFLTVGNSGNAATSFYDTSLNKFWLRVTQQHSNSANAQGVRIGIGSPYLNTNTNNFDLIYTLTQNGTGVEIGNADSNIFQQIRTNRVGNTSPAIDLRPSVWPLGIPTSARTNTFNTITSQTGLVARGGARPSNRNVILKYNTESGEPYPTIEAGAILSAWDDLGNTIGTTGFGGARQSDSATPTSSPSGTGLVATGTRRYRRVGRECFVSLTYSVTTAGSAADYLIMPLPYTATSVAILNGRSGNNGKQLQGYIDPGSSQVLIKTYDNIYPATGTGDGFLSGTYECQ